MTVKTNWDDANDATLKVLVGDLKGNDRRIFLQAKNTGAWMSLRSTMVTGGVFPAMQFRNFLFERYNVTPSSSRATTMYVTLHSRYVTHLAASKEACSWNVTTKCVMNYFTSPNRPSPQHQYASNP